ncbi:L-threonylcarbamoyladenylate synthase [Candidatus Micrarchaeota archaeon]|nr:L-threonylcarbamoyladenylate synthase [Candidatus Micrarchaeota archaeon]
MKTKLFVFSLKEREKAAKILEQVAAILEKGGVVAIPSETCYSLAIDPTNEQSVQRLVDIGVEPGLTNPIVVSDLRMAREYLNVNEAGEKIANSFMPGPVTLVVEVLPDSKLAKGLFENKASFRVSSNVFARALASELGKPVTVAIRPNNPIYMLKELQAAFDGKIDAIVSSGDLIQVRPSTIVDVTGAQPKLVREGPIPFSEVVAIVPIIAEA